MDTVKNLEERVKGLSVQRISTSKQDAEKTDDSAMNMDEITAQIAELRKKTGITTPKSGDVIDVTPIKS